MLNMFGGFLSFCITHTATVQLNNGIYRTHLCNIYLSLTAFNFLKLRLGKVCHHHSGSQKTQHKPSRIGDDKGNRSDLISFN